MNRKNSFIFAFAILIGLSTFAQEGTRSTTESITVSETSPVGKILLIPFDPNLYMSEIDRKIHQQTNWNFNQIREYFRHQLDTQVKLKLSRTSSTISFYSDSLKMAKDLNYIAKSTSLTYEMVDKTKPAPVKQKGIKNGQLAVEINTDKRFMNTKVTDPELLTYLHQKYGTELFVFINELDIKNDMGSYDIASDTYQRTVFVHYSIIDKSAKTIASGIEKSNFSSKVNNPKRIVSQSFTPIATAISAALSNHLMASAAAEKK